MPASTLLPRKHPRQARATAMVELVLEAATRVLSSDSLAGFNTNRVAEVAGISVGSLYQYFPNKSSLIAALIEREQLGLATAIEQCVHLHQQKTLKQNLSKLVDIAIRHQFDRAKYSAALDHEEQRLPLKSVIGPSQARISNAIWKMLKTNRGVIAGAVSKSAAVDCLTITKALVEAETQHAKPDLILLKRRVLRALHGYLQYES
jgi:AcrR family transcriptional regulator